MFRTIAFLWLAWRAYKRAGEKGAHYAAISSHGVPHTAIMVATGREAWRVTCLAISTFDRRKPDQF